MSFHWDASFLVQSVSPIHVLAYLGDRADQFLIWLVMRRGGALKYSAYPESLAPGRFVRSLRSRELADQFLHRFVRSQIS